MFNNRGGDRMRVSTWMTVLVTVFASSSSFADKLDDFKRGHNLAITYKENALATCNKETL